MSSAAPIPIRTSWAHLSRPAGGRMRLVLYASKLAACAGMNPYQTQQELSAELRHARGQGDDAGYLPPREAAARTLDTLGPDARARVDAAMATRYDDAAAVVRAVQEVRDLVKDEVVAEVVQRALYTTHGTQCEAGVRSASEVAVPGRVIRTDASFTVSPTPWLVLADVDVYLGGKHDGTMEQGARIVEIKTRQRRFLGAPRYELIQTHAYMHVYGTRSASLIESYMGQRQEHDIAFDDRLWSDVREAVAEFVQPLLV